MAPSPTGALHLGNARTFLVNWALARRNSWRIVLRIEDLDTPRNKAGAAPGLIDTLRWLGVDWDEGPYVQTDDLEVHRRAMHRLAEARAVYPCSLTRGEIEAAASAPQEGSREIAFPATLRPPLPRDSWWRFDDERTNWRFVVGSRGPVPTHESNPARAPFDADCATHAGGARARAIEPQDRDSEVRFTDTFAGPRSFDVASAIGDFVVWTSRGQPAYQLAVVVDDHRQGVTRVVRGDDLLDSAARQLLLYRALAYTPEPTYLHLPLVVGPDGLRLAKRHGDSRIDTYRAQGVPPESIVGLVARWCGVAEPGEQVSPREFGRRLDLDTIPRGAVVFTPEDHAWLLSTAHRA